MRIYNKLAFGVAISMFSELFTYWYYEKRN